MKNICLLWICSFYLSIITFIESKNDNNVFKDDLTNIYDRFKNDNYILGKYTYRSMPYFNDDDNLIYESENDEKKELDNDNLISKTNVKLPENTVKLTLSSGFNNKLDLYFYNGIYYDEWWNIQIDIKENGEQGINKHLNFFLTYGRYLHKNEIKSSKYKNISSMFL